MVLTPSTPARGGEGGAKVTVASQVRYERAALSLHGDRHKNQHRVRAATDWNHGQRMRMRDLPAYPITIPRHVASACVKRYSQHAHAYIAKSLDRVDRIPGNASECYIYLTLKEKD